MYPAWRHPGGGREGDGPRPLVAISIHLSFHSFGLRRFLLWPVREDHLAPANLRKPLDGPGCVCATVDGRAERAFEAGEEFALFERYAPPARNSCSYLVGVKFFGNR